MPKEETDKEVFERAIGRRPIEEQEESNPRWILPAIIFIMTVFLCFMVYIVLAVQ